MGPVRREETPPTPNVPGRRSAEILARIQGGGDFGGVCTELLCTAMEWTEDGTGLLLVRRDDRVQACGWRIDPEVATEAERRAIEGEGPYAELFVLDDTTAFENPESFTIDDFEPRVAFPVRSPTSQVRAVVLAAGLAGDDEVLHVADTLKSAAPLALPLLELEILRDRVAAAARSESAEGAHPALATGGDPATDPERRADEKGPAIDGLASAVAHGLREPLQAMLGHAELMEDGRFGSFGPTAQAELGRIAAFGRLLNRRLSVALELMNIAAEAGAVPPDQTTPPWGPAALAVRQLSEDARDRGIRVEAGVGKGLPPVRGTAGRLSTLLLAQLRLALLASGPGRLELNGESTGNGEICFSVRHFPEQGPGASAPRRAPEDDTDRGTLEWEVLRFLATGLGGRAETPADPAPGIVGPVTILPGRLES